MTVITLRSTAAPVSAEATAVSILEAQRISSALCGVASEQFPLGPRLTIYHAPRGILRCESVLDCHGVQIREVSR